jgi:hypothetical protein
MTAQNSLEKLLGGSTGNRILFYGYGIRITEIHKMATVVEQVQEIYVGLLGRATDKSGSDYWTGLMTAGIITIEQVRATSLTNRQSTKRV